MALSLAINALSYYRLGTYKTVAVLLSVFFIYDIFMVFVTPQFTQVFLYIKFKIQIYYQNLKNIIIQGTSIMEAVAFGGKDASDSISGTVIIYVLNNFCRHF